MIHQEKPGLINKEASFMRQCWHNVWCTRVPRIVSFALIWLQKLEKRLSSLDWYAGTHLAQVNRLDFVGDSKIMLQAASSFRFPGDLLLTNSGEMGNMVSWKFCAKIHSRHSFRANLHSQYRKKPPFPTYVTYPRCF